MNDSTELALIVAEIRWCLSAALDGTAEAAALLIYLLSVVMIAALLLSGEIPL